jgi:hypothetical protein
LSYFWLYEKGALMERDMLDPSALNLLIGKLLDWPFLLFGSAWILVMWRGKEIMELLAHRKVKIGPVSIDEAIENVQKVATDDFKVVNARIQALESRFSASSGSNFSTEKQDNLTERDRREELFQRMRAALAESESTWRAVERLAISAGVSEKEAHDILADHRREVVLSVGKTGRVIAKLSDR